MKDKTRLTKIIILITLVLITLITCINPIYPNEQYLQHLGTIILLGILFNDLRNHTLTLFAFAFFSLFILFHIIGARYIYSYVPYYNWINIIHDVIGKSSLPYLAERNGYDRFVHFVFGILVFPIIYEYLIHRETNNKTISIFFT